MSLIEFSGLGFGFGGEIILEAAGAAVHSGNCIGLVGPNGAGKTTLLRLLAGELEPDSGRVQRQRGLRLAYCTQAQAGSDAVSVWELVLGRGGAWPARGPLGSEKPPSDLTPDGPPTGGPDPEETSLSVEAKRMLTGLGLGQAYWDAPLGRLSGGQRQKAALAGALIAEADLYLFDEPANHLDFDAQEFLAARLRTLASAGGGRAVVLASHDRWLLDACATHIWELEAGRLYSYPGNFSKSSALRQARREKMAEEYIRQQEYIARTEEYIRRNIAGQNTRQAQGRRTLLARMERVEAVRSDPALSLVLTPASPSGEQVLLAEGLGFGFGAASGGDPPPEQAGADCRPGLALNAPVITASAGAALPGRLVLAGAGFQLHRGERLGISGPNGCGKTTLLRVLARRYQPSAGVLAWGANVRPGFFAQDSADLPAGADMLGALRQGGALASDGELRRYLARFGFSGDDVFKDCASLSGGERSRLSLARIFWQRPNLLLLDEPDNHLDIYAREALEQFLAAYEGTVVLVTHDRALLESVCDRLLAFEPAAGGGFRPAYFRGGYRDYLKWREGAAGRGGPWPARPAPAGKSGVQATGSNGPPPGGPDPDSQREALPPSAELAALAREARMSVGAYCGKQAEKQRRRMAELETLIEAAEAQAAALRAEQRERDRFGDYNAITRLQMEMDPVERLVDGLLDELERCELALKAWEASAGA